MTNSQRNNLMICSASDRSLHHTWLDGDPNRNWDLHLMPYRALSAPQPPDITVDAVVTEQKYAAYYTLLTESRWWRDYRNIMLVDEDIFAMPGTWSRFFDWSDKVNAALSAPALTPNSIFSHPVTVQQPGCVARRTSFVESMMPCFRVGTLTALLPSFTADPTGMGWGLDYAWAKLLNYAGIYVIDATPVTHWRPGTHTRSYWPEVQTVLTKFNAQIVEKTYEVILR